MASTHLDHNTPGTILGNSALAVSRVGYGCMGLTTGYSSDSGVSATFGTTYEPVEADYERGEKAILAAFGCGVNFLDTAEAYGGGGNEQVVGAAIKKIGRENLVIATKFLSVRDADGKGIGISGKPDNVKATADKCLKNLGIDVIDLYYQHRVDPATPIEETVGAMAELVKAGKVKALGLSEAPAAIIRRAHAVHPISAVQVEYSLWFRDIERNGVLATCRELGITIVAYSPVGRGMLTGKFKKAEDIKENDCRLNHPRFQGEHFERNVAAVAVVEEIAAKHSATASQVALAWLLAQGEDIVPIPGSCNPVHIRENSESTKIRLTEEDMGKLSELEKQTTGERYDAQGMKIVMEGAVWQQQE